MGGPHILEYFCQISRYKDTDWLLLIVLDKVVGEEGRPQAFKFSAAQSITWKFLCLPWEKSLPPVATELKIKPTVSSCKWLNYKTHWIIDLAVWLLWKWGHWLGRNGILKSGMGIYVKILMKLGTLSPKILLSILYLS